VRTQVTESHFSRDVRLSSGFQGRSSHFPRQTARPSLNLKRHGAETAHLIGVGVVEEEVQPGVHGCNDRHHGTAAANILSAKDWASCLGCRAHNSSWECQTVWSSRAASSMSCQRAGKTRARWRARPSKIGELCALIAALTFLVPSVAYAADPEVLVAHRGVAGGETGGAEHPGELDPGVAVGDRQLRQYRRPGCAERRRRR
jgi:hypothetical protein